MNLLSRLQQVLDQAPNRVVACSGGVDSLLLATIAHRTSPSGTVVAHAVTPAVPPAATARTRATAAQYGWDLRTVASGEFADERYLSNPANRCYFCKSHLYEALDIIAAPDGWAVLSGANVDDLGEYRPGLVAAAEHRVRHPYVEAGIDKVGIRRLATSFGLDFADLPASPCLSSRLYTGTRVTAGRLAAIDAAEELIRRTTGVSVVRCRIRSDRAVIEVGENDRALVDERVLAAVRELLVEMEPSIASVALDDRPYRPGRAIVVSS